MNSPIGKAFLGVAQDITPERMEAYEAEVEQALVAVLANNQNQQVGPDGKYGYFHWQTGPHSAGRNGIEVDELVSILIDRMELLQAISSCRENALILGKLEEVTMLVELRRKLRDEQNVRGSNAPHRSVGQRYTLDHWGLVMPPAPWNEELEMTNETNQNPDEQDSEQVTDAERRDAAMPLATEPNTAKTNPGDTPPDGGEVVDLETGKVHIEGHASPIDATPSEVISEPANSSGPSPAIESDAVDAASVGPAEDKVPGVSDTGSADGVSGPGHDEGIVEQNAELLRASDPDTLTQTPQPRPGDEPRPPVRGFGRETSDRLGDSAREQLGEAESESDEEDKS